MLNVRKEYPPRIKIPPNSSHVDIMIKKTNTFALSHHQHIPISFKTGEYNGTVDIDMKVHDKILWIKIGGLIEKLLQKKKPVNVFI